MQQNPFLIIMLLLSSLLEQRNGVDGVDIVISQDEQ